jgi:signal peptidase I
MNKVLKIFILFALLALIGYQFIFHPYKVLGDDVGPYKNRQVVFAIAKFLLPFRPIQRGDVVILQRSTETSLDEPLADPSFTAVALVLGVPGDKVTDNTYYLSGDKLEGTVPSDFYLAKFGTSNRDRAIPESQITHLVWFSFK